MTTNGARVVAASRNLLFLAVALAPSLAAAETGRYGADDYSVIYNDPNTDPPNQPINIPVDDKSQDISYRFSYLGPNGGSFYDPANWQFAASGRPGGFINGNAITGTFVPETPSYVADMTRPDGSSAGTPREGYTAIHHLPQYTTVIGNGNNVIFDPVGEGQNDTVYSVNLLYAGGLTGEGNVGGTLTIKSGVIEGRAAFFYGVDGTTLNRQPARFIIGRNNKATATGYVIQTGGTYRQVLYYQDVAQTNPGTSNFIQIGSTATVNMVATGGKGIYDYSGGIIDNSGVGTNAQVAMLVGADADGDGRFIMRSPTAPGYVRVRHLLFSNNSRTQGVLEFHYGAGGFRPFQVMDGLNLSNTTVANSRSSMLDFRLDAAPTLTAGVPLNIGMIDVDFDNDGVGTIGGSSGGTTPAKFGGNFYAMDNLTRLAEGTTVSAMFAGSTYNWTISYTGNITWDVNNNVTAVTGPGTGKDVVLIGQSSVLVSPTGDFNSDGDVDGDDFNAWVGGFGTGTTRLQGNADFDGDVDGGDFLVWQQQFGTQPPIGTAVPEPASCVLAAMVALLALRGGRTRP